MEHLHTGKCLLAAIVVGFLKMKCGGDILTQRVHWEDTFLPGCRELHHAGDLVRLRRMRGCCGSRRKF